MHSRLIDFNGIPSVLCTGRDITERKKIEAERRKVQECLRESEGQLRGMTTRLLEIQEEERGRIGKELHYELGQSLILLKLQLSSVMDRLRKDQGKLCQECSYMLNEVDALIEDIRRLIAEGGLFPQAAPRLGAAARGFKLQGKKVLALVAEGCSRKEVAEKLGISVSPVQSHRDNIKKKLNIKRTAELIKYAIEEGYTVPREVSDCSYLDNN